MNARAHGPPRHGRRRPLPLRLPHPDASPGSRTRRARRKSRPSAPTAAAWRSCAATTCTSSSWRPARGERAPRPPTARRTSSTASWTGSTRRRSTAAATSRATGGAPTRGGSRSSSSTRRACHVHRGGRHRGAAPTLEDIRYPKAGDPNPEVRLGIVDAAAAAVRAGWTSRGTRPRALIVDVALEPRRPARGLPGAGPRADLARPERCADAGDAAAADAAPRDDARPGWSRRTSRTLAARRRVPVAERAHAAGSTSTATARDGTLVAPGHARRVGSAHAARRRRGRAAGLLLGHRAQPDRQRTSTASSSTARACSASRGRRARTARSFNPSFTLYLDTWSDAHHAAPRCACTGADGARGARDRRQPRARARRVPPRAAGAPAGAHARRLPDGGDADQAARLRPARKLSRLPAHLRRPARAAGARTPGAGTTYLFHQLLAQRGRGGLDLRQPHGQRQGRAVPPGPCTRAWASWSCATSRTGWTG